MTTKTSDIAEQDALGRKRLAYALGIDPEQDIITIWHLIEQRVSEALAAKEWADQILREAERKQLRDHKIWDPHVNDWVEAKNASN